jgi:hypothetical protein
MNPDELKQAWQTQTSQSHLTIDAELLLNEIRRNQKNFSAMIFWRDFREVGVSLLMTPLWIYLGLRMSLPWTWYLAVPAMLWIACYMLVDRWRHKGPAPQPGEPLRQRVESLLAEVAHQIRLLRNVFWWYLLPLLIPMLAFFGQVAWQQRSGGWLTAVSLAIVVAIVLIVFASIYWLNQKAVGSELEPRRQELETMLASLRDETPSAS